MPRSEKTVLQIDAEITVLERSIRYHHRLADAKKDQMYKLIAQRRQVANERPLFSVERRGFQAS